MKQGLLACVNHNNHLNKYRWMKGKKVRWPFRQRSIWRNLTFFVTFLRQGKKVNNQLKKFCKPIITMQQLFGNGYIYTWRKQRTIQYQRMIFTVLTTGINAQ